MQLEAVTTPGVQCEFLGFDVHLSLRLQWNNRSSLYLSRASNIINIRKYVGPPDRQDRQLAELDKLIKRLHTMY